MRIIYLIYQWIIAYPLIIVCTLITSLFTIKGSAIGNRDFWGYNHPK